MSSEPKPTNPLSRVELGVIVTVVLAIIGGVYYIGQFEGRLSSIEGDRDSINKNIQTTKELASDITNSAQELAGQNAVPVGTIVASYLAPGAFTAKSGTQWAPADGSPCPTDSKYYAENGIPDQLPDLRGQFLRGLNTFSATMGERNDEKKDPDGKDRTAGHYQSSAVGPHKHTLPPFLTAKGTAKVESSDYRTGNKMVESKTTIDTTPEASETRPANTAVYFYIKIN